MCVSIKANVLLGVAMVGMLVSPTFSSPNFIVLQPDDHEFFEMWTPPAHFSAANVFEYPPGSDLPNMNLLRQNGVQFKRAYAASAMCGTSRYSTMTGRFPSRASLSRRRNAGLNIGEVTIPTTRLSDNGRVTDGDDCTTGNAAALFQANGYSTGVVGKWHLFNDNGVYSYVATQDTIRACGFDFAEAIYHDNLNDNWAPGLNHNMEHVTAKAIEFMTQAINVDQKPFFLYMNPTVPHNSGDVSDALANDDCRNTVEGFLPEEPYIPFGMTADYANCSEYRQTVLDRGSTNDKLAGAVWLDDAIASILMTLENLNQLDNTFFLFQLDHGQEGKSTLYETGGRIAQFVHYPAAIQPGTTFEGIVTTIDIVPTMMDFAGIDANSLGYYEMDGRSWKEEVVNQNSDWTEDVCGYFELDFDRAVVCGCHKYMHIQDPSDTSGGTAMNAVNLGYTLGAENYFHLCDSAGNYATSPHDNPEQDGTILPGDQAVAEELKAILECYLGYTDPNAAPDYNVQCTNTLVATASPRGTFEPIVEVVCPDCTRDAAEPRITMHRIDELDHTCQERCTDESVRAQREGAGWVCGPCPAPDASCSTCVTPTSGSAGYDMSKLVNGICMEECVPQEAFVLRTVEGWFCGTCSGA